MHGYNKMLLKQIEQIDERKDTSELETADSINANKLARQKKCGTKTRQRK